MALAANLTSKPGISGTATLPVSDWTRPQALDAFLAENPYALLDVPCDQIPAWETVGEYAPPQSVMDRLTAHPGAPGARQGREGRARRGGQ